MRFATSFASGRRQNRAIWVTFKEPVLIVRATTVAVGSHLRFSGQDLESPPSQSLEEKMICLKGKAGWPSSSSKSIVGHNC